MTAGAEAGCPRDEHTSQSQRRSRPDTDSKKTGGKKITEMSLKNNDLNI